MLNNNYYDIILILQRYNIFFINKIFEKKFGNYILFFTQKNLDLM